MKKIFGIGILALSSFLFIPVTGHAQTPTFTDISSSHWAADSITWAVEHHIVEGYTDRSFRPTVLVSEAEFLKMLIEKQQIVLENQTDSSWSAPYYAYASEHHWPISGEQDAKSQSLSRLTVAELIAAAEGRSDRGNEAIQNLLDRGISKGKSEATVSGYDGSAFLSRAEAVSFLHRLTEPPKQNSSSANSSVLSASMGGMPLPEYTFEVPTYKKDSKLIANAYVQMMQKEFEITVTGQAPSKSYSAEKIPGILKDISEPHSDYFYTLRSKTLFPYDFTSMGMIVQVLNIETEGKYDFINLLYQHLAYGLEPAADRAGDYVIVVEPNMGIPGYGLFNVYQKVNRPPDNASLYNDFIEAIYP